MNEKAATSRICRICRLEKLNEEFCSGISLRWDRVCKQCHEEFIRGFHGNTFTKVFRTPEKTAFSKKMRKDPTPPERRLWMELKSSKLGVRFRRQVIMFGYILDFYSFPVKLCVEVDGKIHEQRQQEDKTRDEGLESRGIKTLRFASRDVLSNIDGVVQKIKEAADARSGIRLTYKRRPLP